MRVLGLETSCDETAVAIVDGDRAILSNIVLSQKGHQIYGGVVPEIAARAHLDHVDHMVNAALTEAKMTLADVDAIAVTSGPGLMGGLLVGVMTAQALGAVTGKPVFGINHLEGHALTARLTDDAAFPYLLLLVSGGHTQILIVDGVGKYRQLGTTIDDAVGEAFDKTAKILGYGYPGGPQVEAAAATAGAAAAMIDLPKPFLGAAHCHFSFSGLKSALRRGVEAHTSLSESERAAIARDFQNTVADILADRVARALDLYLDAKPARPLCVVAGGVAANKTIRARLESLCRDKNVGFSAPPQKLCTDNAAMIAWAGIERLRRGDRPEHNITIRARWPLDPSAQGKGKIA
jgi:N6-L-threonylcarbamoyladenine synthase